ncbi:hypothetical protein CHS0354_039881 [Potamilus streckersoni]|uniref:Transglutaminase-like domain-containing protein n=1 Tax=Potamilus streckersoni TaxID=2493646 RepID=A0AAE0SIW0_9BIVA|nr:hypothetical protein CHS0354_039881 [Potamilus streckersoni]
MTRTRGRRSGEGDTVQPPKRSRHHYNLRATSSRVKRDKKLGREIEGRRNNISDEDFRDKNKVLKVDVIGDALKVESINYHLEENRKSHHTDEYELESLIVRRGQGFTLSITFDRNINQEEDIIYVQFTTGARPQESKGTLMRIPINVKDQTTTKDAAGDWSVQVTKVEGHSVTFSVNTEPDDIIGTYATFIETKLEGKSEDFTRFESDALFYLIFNPWCKDDVVYMENEQERFEYILNHMGRIWVGNKDHHRGRPWNFGQFENPCLQVALDLLDKAELIDVARASVVTVVRTISALANSMDEDGVLEGRWTNEYPKGTTKPWEWTGSVAILEQFHNTGKPVQFGQCWVFSGIVTTLLRTLGVPTRSITNFESAHDTDCSMTIDRHWNEDGIPVDYLDDSVWNFHVWNESWFRRLDLPSGYDGWQVHDATPQETSEDVMRCGPASVKAVKEGHVYLNYDVGFVFAEVNGDRVQWRVNKDGSMEVLSIDRYSVGKRISTKAVGSNERHDLTWDYKYQDGSENERRVVEFVNHFSTRRKNNIYKKSQEQEVKFKLILPRDKMVGEDIEVGVVVENLLSKDRKIKVTLTVTSMYYTGVVGTRVKAETTEIDLPSDKDAKVMMTITNEEYESVMNSQGDFKIFVACQVLETNDMFTAQEAFSLKRPELEIKVPEKVDLMVKSTAIVKFKNQTNRSLHNGVFHVEGSYVVKATTIHSKKLIKPGEKVKAEITLYPSRVGTHVIMVSFGSDEVASIESEAEVMVIGKRTTELLEKEDDKMEVEENTTADSGIGDGNRENMAAASGEVGDS